MKLLVDGAGFQLGRSGDARMWASLLKRLARFSDIEIRILDRGRCPVMDGVQRMEFPSYTATSTAADSLLIDEVGRDWGADIFCSSYYTTPVSIPSVVIARDMSSEGFSFDFPDRIWQERKLAIGFARSFCSVSSSVKSDLLKYYPCTSDRPSIVAYCGVDHDIFRPRSGADVEIFKQEHRLTRPYFLLVGSLDQRKHYKNTQILFDAMRMNSGAELDILCVGAESELPQGFRSALLNNVGFKTVDVDDEGLARAYAGAEALVYPSLYEGSGLPVLEAMACGCPVITTTHGALKEVAGDAAEFVSGRDKHEVAKALDAVRQPPRRAELIERGFQQTRRFSWDRMAEAFRELLVATAARSEDRSTQRFLAEWKRLREIQAAVDVG